MLHINEAEVLELLAWDETFDAIETSMRRVSEGRVDQTARTKTAIPNSNNALFTMPGYLDDDKYGALSCKIITVFPNNFKLSKPAPNLIANILHMDEETGAVKAIISGSEITKWRTAAASAVATKHVYEKRMKPGADRTLAILGAGEQGRIHAHCFKYFFTFKEIRIWNRSASKGRALVEELNKTYKSAVFKYIESREACVRGADVIVTTTFSAEPIVLAKWVKPGAHINAVGSSGIHYSELERKLYDCSDIYIDSWNGANKELKGLIDDRVAIKGEVGEVIMKRVESVDVGKVTIFQSLGMAVEDCAMARLIYDKFITNENRNQPE